MPFSIEVPMLDGTTYTVKRLLAKGDSNQKINKSENSGLGWMTMGLSLAPWNSSGFNLCPSASPACISGCLNTSGNAMIWPEMIQKARIARSRAFRLSKTRQKFFDRLNLELTLGERLATRKGKRLCVRLNVYSDVQWEREFPTLFTMHPQIQFYDYTKLKNRMIRFLAGDFPPNYHLTFSRSEINQAEAIEIRRLGGNIAVVFDIKPKRPLPLRWHRFKVIDGDLTDLRFLDPKGCIVGLRAKGKARKDKTSGFVVAPQRTVAIV